MAKAETTEKTNADRALYFDEAIRSLPLREFLRVVHSLPHRRPRFQTQTTRRS